MYNFYNAKLCVGPTEPSGHVAVKEDYNYEVFNIVSTSNPVYWDDEFRGKLNNTSNLSYASVPVAKDRQRKHWRDTADSSCPIIGTRGVKDGVVDDSNAPTSFNNSMTLAIHGGRKDWDGNIGYNDGRVEYTRTFKPAGLMFKNGANYEPDNLFRNDVPPGGSTSPNGDDAWLVVIDRGSMLAPQNDVIGFLCEWD
jgi:hypothetical protein